MPTPNLTGITFVEVPTCLFNIKRKCWRDLCNWGFCASTVKISFFICLETGGILNSLTSSVPQSLEIPQVSDLRFCWLKDAVFQVNVLQKISAIPALENYICYLINIVSVALKKNLPIETSYSVIYTKNRKNEREATNLAGFDVSLFRSIVLGYTSSDGWSTYLQFWSWLC